MGCPIINTGLWSRGRKAHIILGLSPHPSQ